MRGYPDYNWPAFDRAAGMLTEHGWTVINPAAIDRSLGITEATKFTDADYQSAMRRDLAEILGDCVAIWLLPGWEDSAGALVEQAVARAIGLEVFYVQRSWVEDLPGYSGDAGPVARLGKLSANTGPASRAAVGSWGLSGNLSVGGPVEPVLTGDHDSREAFIPAPATVLDEAKEIVFGARAKAYGHPRDNFARTAQIWSVVLGHDVTPEQVGLCMVGLKLAREVHSPSRDNKVDMAGYVATLERLAEPYTTTQGPTGTPRA